MPRRKADEGWFDLCLWLFTRYSAWLCVPVAIATFLGINVFALILGSISPVFKGLASLGPVFGLLFGGIILLLGLKAGVGKLDRRDLYDRQTSIESIRTLSWSEFEKLIGEAYRRQGYSVTETGGGGADGGVDLRLRNANETVLVQCKQWKAYKVGVRPIRELYGVLKASSANRATLVTSGVFTQEARDFAAGKPLELIDGPSLSRLVSAVKPVSLPPPLAITTTNSTPACPECGKGMVLRTAKRGSNPGSQFWGCSTYPKCRGIRQQSTIPA